VPVDHRRRSHGRSHYTLWNRSLQVVIDLLGVAWLMQRPVRYEVLETRYTGAIRNGAQLDVLRRTAEHQLIAVQ